MNQENAYEALAELLYRNPQRHDGHGYDLDLAAWGLGINPHRPNPDDFGQVETPTERIADFVEGLREIYEDEATP